MLGVLFVEDLMEIRYPKQTCLITADRNKIPDSSVIPELN